MSKSRPVRTHVPPHAFVADAALSRTWNAQPWCATCGLPGIAGDERHPTDTGSGRSPAYPTDDEVRALTARILGEAPDDDEGENSR